MREKIGNKNLQKSSSSLRPWEWIDEDTVKIQNSKGCYIVNFNCIDWVSQDHKERIFISSEISRRVKKLFSEKVKNNDKEIIEYIRNKSLLRRPFGVFSWSEKDTIMNNLTEKQKNIFNFLRSDKNITIDDVIEKFGLPEIVVLKDIKKIMSEILKVKPEFKSYYKTPNYLPEIRKRTVIKPSSTAQDEIHR